MNNNHSSKNLFGISKYGTSGPVIGLYVDLLTNQSINGIKTFLSNLITNNDVNFNTTNNIGRIVFKPNEAPGFSGNLLSIYTTDENDTQGWIFDADGNLYYLGTGFIPQKIFFSPTGNINAIGAITCGSLDAITGTIQTTGAIFGGSITGSSSITGGTGSFTTINGNSLNVGSGPITGGAGSFTTGDFSANVNITGATNGLIISGGFSGLFCNKIESQSGGAIVSSAVFNLRNALAVTNIVLDPLGAYRLKINGITGTNSYLFFNHANLFAFFNTSIGANTWSITDLGVISCNSITASTSLTTNLINASTGTNKIQMDNRFFNTGVGSIDLKSTYIGFPQLTQTLTTASKYMAIIPATDGNFTMSINNIANRVLFSNWSTLTLTSEFIFTAPTINATTSLKTNLIEPYSGTIINVNPISNFNWLKSAGNNRIVFRPQSTTDDILQIHQTGSNTPSDGFLYFNNNGFLGYFITSSSSWTISKAGAAIFSQINCSGLTCTTIQTNGNTINCGVINSSNINSSGTINCGGITCSTIQTNNNTITCGNVFSSGNVSAPSMNITNNANNALTLNSGGIHLQNNNWLFGRCKFGDADYAYIAEYDTGDSDKLYLFGSTGIYCNTLPVVVSDKRLKENIEDFIIDNPLEIIDKIRLVEYNRIDNPSKTRVLGYIAQEILEIFPKAVEIDQTVIKKDENSVLFKKHNDGTDSEEPEREERLALNYSYISMLNTEAIKQLNELVKKQQTLIDTLVKRIEILENNVVINKQ
jgi:hypothetical protein